MVDDAGHLLQSLRPQSASLETTSN